MNVNDVLAASSIMFKMKSNAFLLTIITTITAISLTAISLAYISYYSAERMTEQMNPYDYIFVTEDDTTLPIVSEALTEEGFEHETISFDFSSYIIELPESQTSTVMSLDDQTLGSMSVVSDKHFTDIDVEGDTGILTGSMSIIDEIMNLSELEELIFSNDEDFERLITITEQQENAVVPPAYTYGQPALVIADEMFELLETHMDDKLYFESMVYAINVEDDNEEVLEIVQSVFDPHVPEDSWAYFQNKTSETQYMKQIMGLTMFIMGFIGLAFLIASGCILYFKQIAESDDERGNYTILRKLGFTESEMLRGLALKMLFSFGIPLFIGILHSVFAVRAGWFIFGSELLVPTVTVIILYTVLYSIFALFSLLYYRRVVRESL